MFFLAGLGREFIVGVILRDFFLGFVFVFDFLRFFRRYNSKNNNCTNWVVGGSFVDVISFGFFVVL